LYRDTWRHNVKQLLAENNLSIAEAARLVGTSKQYLSAILAETEPSSMRELVADRLSLLLHATPARLYTPSEEPSASRRMPTESSWHTPEESLAPVEQAVLAERHFLAREYGASFRLAKALLLQHGDELAPAAVAHTELLAGKSACLLGHSTDANAHLRRALAFWQKRLTAQPAKYLSHCLDTYRYLALAAHVDEDYARALELQLRAIALYERFPQAASELTGKWEALALNSMRTATRISLRTVSDTADRLLAFSTVAKLQALTMRFSYDLEFCRYAIGRATGDASAPCYEPPSTMRDAALYLGYGLTLWERGESDALRALADSLSAESDSQEQQFVRSWLTQMAAPLESRARSNDSPTALFAGLTALLDACCASAAGDNYRALHAWQSALRELLSARDYPLYFLAFAGGLKHFTLADSYRHDLQAVLALRVRAYKQ
jgi:hypothetical protein